MKERKNDLRKEQGSVQRQTQESQSYSDTDLNKKQKSEQGNHNQFGVIPVPEAQEKKIGGNKGKKQPDLKEIDDEKVIPGIKTKRSSWNSVDFETDDFFGGWVPA